MRQNEITINTVEEHNYSHEHKTIWRDNQEYVLFAFIETGYTLTRTTQGSYTTSDRKTLNFSETTTETMTRSLTSTDAITGIPEDWQGDINMVSSETITRSTVRNGGKSLESGMPDYSPPFDSRITRTFKRQNGKKGLLCNELEEVYEMRQVGRVARVTTTVDGVVTYRDIGLQEVIAPKWVLVKTYRSYYEKYDNEGECIISTKSEYSDNGAEWLANNWLYDTGNNDLNEYEQSYAKFSQNSSGLSVSFGSSGIVPTWSFIELQGRMKSTRSDVEGIALGSMDTWYNNGEYVRTSVCPHYNESTKSCNIYALDETSDDRCLYSKGLNWAYLCERAHQALEIARHYDKSQLEPVIIGSASRSASASKSPAVGYQREFYVDEILDDDTAQSIADTIATNILAVKSIKGLRKTVTVPYDASYQPDGNIVEVSHDWENLHTSITYREAGDIPEFLISQSVSSVAAFVSARDTARLNIPRYGSVLEISNENISVQIGSSSVSCSTKLKNIAQGDIVLVVFPAGNKLRGQVISRL